MSYHDLLLRPCAAVPQYSAARRRRCACSLLSDLSCLSSDLVYHAFSICRGNSFVKIVIHVLIVANMPASETTAVRGFLAVFPARSNYHKGADVLRFEPTTCGCAVSGVPGAGGNSPPGMPLSHGGDDDSVWPGRPRGGIAGCSERPSPKTALLLPSLAVGTAQCAVGDPGGSTMAAACCSATAIRTLHTVTSSSTTVHRRPSYHETLTPVWRYGVYR